MPLRKTMPMNPRPDDPRTHGHETTYQATRGGWVKPPKQPTPATPKTGR